MATSDKVIEARNLHKSFGSFTAVEDLSFDLYAGECLGLLGPNGAGKTSTIRMIYGFSPITSGSLEVFGIPMPRGWREIRHGIGVCQQENSLDPDLTVLQNLEIYAGYFDIKPAEAKKSAESLLNFMGLEHRARDTVTTLSGGMMRRLVLARALINNPRLLILDEPTTGLDPQSRHQVWEKLEKLRQQGLSILLTTHYMEEASRICDRLIIVDNGKLLVTGNPHDLIYQYAGRDVLEVLDPTKELRDMVESLSIMHDLLDTRLIIYGSHGEDVFDSISSEFCDSRCIRRMATLEDVFLRLTGRDLRE